MLGRCLEFSSDIARELQVGIFTQFLNYSATNDTLPNSMNVTQVSGKNLPAEQKLMEHLRSNNLNPQVRGKLGGPYVIRIGWSPQRQSN